MPPRCAERWSSTSTTWERAVIEVFAKRYGAADGPTTVALDPQEDAMAAAQEKGLGSRCGEVAQRLRDVGKGDLAKRVHSSARSRGVVAHLDGALARNILAASFAADDELSADSGPGSSEIAKQPSAAALVGGRAPAEGAERVAQRLLSIGRQIDMLSGTQMNQEGRSESERLRLLHQVDEHLKFWVDQRVAELAGKLGYHERVEYDIEVFAENIKSRLSEVEARLEEHPPGATVVSEAIATHLVVGRKPLVPRVVLLLRFYLPRRHHLQPTPAQPQMPAPLGLAPLSLRATAHRH